MAYTDIDDPTAYFQTKTYTGNGSARAITFDGNSDLQPDWVWIKKRNGTTSHTVTDSVRGVNKQLFTNEVEAEESYTSVLTAFDSDGFSLSTAGLINASSDTYVAWNWKAGTSFTNDASATGIGSIDSTGSVNDTAGFSIVSYTGTGSAGTIKHGLSSVPYMMIIKKRNSGTGSNWLVYHKSISGTGDGHIWLDLTNARGDDTNTWNNTAPTSSVFSIGTRTENNASGSTYIGYIFAEKQGYSKFSSFVGNGNASGTFVYTGFKPAFVMVKRTDSTANWQILDNKRNTYNPWNTALFPDTSDPDTTDYSTDHLSNGFKLRVTTTSRNGSGATYIYMAFSENPFVTSTGVPATAR